MSMQTQNHRILQRPPLQEAILEVHWALQPGLLPETQRDVHYQLLLGKLFDTVKSDFPFHEQLPAASAPPELTPHVVHHRFRVAPNGWPLLQVGPGVLTVNETKKYVWSNFEQHINRAIPALIASHPKPDDLKFELLMLRFLNGVELDPIKTNVLQFLSSKMQTEISLPRSILSDNRILATPYAIQTELTFPCQRPRGGLIFKFHTGKRNDRPTLFFELWCVSRHADLPSMPTGFSEWAESAHAVIEDSFFRLIEGALEREFSADA